MTALLALGACAGFGLGDSATATLPGSNGYILPAVALLSAVLIACCPWRAVALIGQLALIASLLSGYLPEPLPADLGTGLGSLAALLTLALPLALFAKGGPRSTALRRIGLGLSLALGGAFLLSLALSFAPADISRGTLAALTLLSAIGTLRCRCGENELAAIAEDSAAATPRPFAAVPFGIASSSASPPSPSPSSSPAPPSPPSSSPASPCSPSVASRASAPFWSPAPSPASSSPPASAASTSASSP